MQIFLSLLLAPAFAGEFTDDENTKHTWTKAKPTILINARKALGLMHFGLGADQLYAVFGQRSTSGSNYGSVYADGNQADHGDHEDAVFDLDEWPSHPDAAEMKVLEAAHDLSPGCSDSNFWCTELQWKIFDTEGWPDLIIHHQFDEYAWTDEFLGNATAKNIPVIKILWSDAPASGNADDPRTARSYIEITHRIEELAIALGAEGADVAASVKEEKIEFCKAAEEFKDAAKGAADRGVRALAGYFPYSGSNDGVNDDGKSIYGFLYGPPTDQVLLMLEELGMQIMHTAGDAVEYNTHMFPDNLTSIATGRPKWTADFLLPDIRVWLDVSSEEFATKWPHPAIVQGQFAPYPSGGRVHSYQHGANLLARVTAVLKDAKKLDSTETTCTDVSGMGGDKHRTDGLAVTEYACYNPVEYDWCPPTPAPTPPPTEGAVDESSATFAAVGLMLAVSAA
jgi:hypothetical protein